MKVTRKDGPGKAILKRLADQAARQVAQVGFLPGGKAYPETGELVAAVAAKQEYGDPASRIPPRSFMRSTISERREEWRELVMDGCKMVAQGKLSIVDVLSGVGLQAEGDVVKKISEIWEPALSPVTIMIRKFKKENRDLHVSPAVLKQAWLRVQAGETTEGISEKPLVDTGTMLAQITHAVVKK